VANANVINTGASSRSRTPPAIVAKLNAEVQKVLAQPRSASALSAKAPKSSAVRRSGSTLIEADLSGWKKLIVEAKITLE
jgi:tripartite-type tricarboxylate transporter receptor subunit TctC